MCECVYINSVARLLPLPHAQWSLQRPLPPQAAQLAQMASTELFQALYFTGQQDSSRREVGGVIYALRTNGVLVFIPRLVAAFV